MYNIKKRDQAPQYVKYTQHEFIYLGDVKLPLHIDNKYQINFENNFDDTLKQNLKLLVVSKINFDTN